MDPEKQRLIASKGGKRAHAAGKAYKWDSKTASLAAKNAWKKKAQGVE